jgi:hypothetical protein
MESCQPIDRLNDKKIRRKYCVFEFECKLNPEEFTIFIPVFKLVNSQYALH